MKKLLECSWMFYFSTGNLQCEVMSEIIIQHWNIELAMLLQIQVVDLCISYWLTLHLAQCNLICFGVAIWVPKIYLMHPTLCLDRFELFQIYFQHWVLDYDSRDGYTIKEFEFFVLELGEENSIFICLFNKNIIMK
jgi:hypothetical protein